ncbi:ubiquitin carboxyl-terminal hydrolase 26 [Trichechus manatus latirostris]|uniref:Ubiquitin carboxyl-terminal hydrolase 26 n=1 Tax=Trichechus manatus latirostris TaxID=127582 RepID=A0A2Y9R3E3_TRIMA|nr:ubiquitin carboxyl-terminal hydrolase 26 [Trichechus manatus latirostris]
MYQEDISLSLIREDGSKPISSLGAGLAEVHLQQMSKNPELTKYKKPNKFLELDYDCAQIPEGSEEVAVQPHKYDWMKFYGHFSQQALPPSLQKPDAQGHTENFRRPTELSLQEAKVKSLGALRSSNNSGKKDILDRKKKETKAKKRERTALKIGPHAYRLISVVNHLGSSPHSGHYINDVYNFERQLWFTFSDMQVTVLTEVPMKGCRLSSGYIFFYMHNEIFEELSRREENSQLYSTKAGEKSQKE